MVPIEQSYELYSPFQYPWVTVNVLIGIWCLSSFVRGCLSRGSTRKSFDGLDEAKKRNTVTYAILFLGTSVALFLQIYGGVDVLFRNKSTTSQSRMDAAVLSVQFILFYLWEMFYRIEIGYPLLTHHICCLLLGQFVTASFYDTQEVIYLRFAILLGFQATTEQLSFLALFIYRLKIFPQYHRRVFHVAAWQSFIVKTLVTIASVVYYFLEFLINDFDPTSWGLFWKIAFPLILLPLYIAQLYASYILYVLGNRCHDSSVAEEGITEKQINTTEAVDDDDSVVTV